MAASPLHLPGAAAQQAQQEQMVQAMRMQVAIQFASALLPIEYESALQNAKLLRNADDDSPLNIELNAKRPIQVAIDLAELFLIEVGIAKRRE